MSIVYCSFPTRSIIRDYFGLQFKKRLKSIVVGKHGGVSLRHLVTLHLRSESRDRTINGSRLQNPKACPPNHFFS